MHKYSLIALSSPAGNALDPPWNKHRNNTLVTERSTTHPSLPNICYKGAESRPASRIENNKLLNIFQFCRRKIKMQIRLVVHNWHKNWYLHVTTPSIKISSISHTFRDGSGKLLSYKYFKGTKRLLYKTLSLIYRQSTSEVLMTVPPRHDNTD